MLRRLVVIAILCVAAPARADDDCTCNATPAACDLGCACDSECAVDWSVDECTLPGASCQPEAADPDDATLDASEVAAPSEPEPTTWTVAADQVACPEGAVLDAGRCRPEAGLARDATGGCATTAPAGLVVGVLCVLVLSRRRRWLLLSLAACAVDDGGWDRAVDDGALDPAHYADVYAAELGDGAQYLLANQALAAGAPDPAAQFALARDAGGVPIVRIATATGDRLVTTYRDDGELLGWARASGGDGTAELVELAAPSGAFAYEIDPETIAELVATGYAITGSIGHVWPPGLTEAAPPETAEPLDPITPPAACTVSRHAATQSALVFLYASPGADESERFLLGCPGEVVIGEKRETGPVGRMHLLANQALGGRTAFVLDRNGDKLRALLLRPNGLERTIAYLNHKLAIGYDYIAIDEITAAPDFRDGTTLNRRLRALMLRMPIRTIIPYISIDLTQYPNGLADMRARRLLLRSFKLRARALALEIYLHTPEVMAGAAPATFRRAADRLALAVHGLPRTGGINLRAVSVIGTSMHSQFAQYRYLDEPSHDLASITRQINAIRRGGRRLRQQHGVGYYFVNQSDMAPVSGAPYSYDALIRRMRLQALRFR